MSLHKIKGRIWADTSGHNGGNMGAVVLGSDIVMIDTGMYHTLTEPIKEFIVPNLGRGISRVLFTHCHADHVFGAQVFHHAEFIGSKLMKELCLKSLDNEWSHETLMQVADQAKDEDPLLSENLKSLDIHVPTITFDHEYEVNHSITMRLMGGHTAGSSIVIVEPEHVLFSGDLIFNQNFPFAGDPSCNPDQWIDSLREILTEDYSIIIPGHGPPCDNETVQQLLDTLVLLRERILTAIDKKWSPSKFINNDMVPEYYNDGNEMRIERTVNHWFEFYKSQVGNR